MNRLALTILILIFSNLAQAKYIVVGGGPTGLYTAYSLLLNDSKAEVELYESRDFIRPQVIRVPFKLTEKLSSEIIENLWPDESTRSRIFKPGDINDARFWPKPDYSYWPFINVGNFQSIMLSSLKENKRFKHISGNLTLEEFEKIGYETNSKIQAVFVATGAGQFTRSLRTKLQMTEGKNPEDKGHGIYLIYRNKSLETYTNMKSKDLGADGLTYAASNNQNRDVQIYTYPATQGPLKEVYDALKGEVAKEFTDRAQFKNYLSEPLFLKEKYLVTQQSEGSIWFASFRKALVELSKKHKIPLPEDLENVKVIYAKRSEYHWKKVSKTLNNNVPLYFVGDASGSTDYKWGLSLGRGLLAVDKLTLLIHKNPEVAVSKFQNYWNRVVNTEFGKDSSLVNEFHIKFKYLIFGRKIKRINPFSFPVHPHLSWLEQPLHRVTRTLLKILLTSLNLEKGKTFNPGIEITSLPFFPIYLN